MAALERHADDFVDRNAFLHLALGLAAAGRRVEALALRPAAPDAPPLDARDERFVDAVVGLLAFTRDVSGRLDASARAVPAAAPAVAPPARIPLR